MRPTARRWREALDRIAALYAVEDIRGAPLGRRCYEHQARAGPLLKGLRALLKATLPNLLRKSDLDDGRPEIDNNAAERAFRGAALGRKDRLFAGSDRGGERTVTIYCLIETAKLNGVDPAAWLRHTIDHIADHPARRVDELLPWNYRPA